MIHDPFLDPPRDRPGCLRLVLVLVAIEATAVLVWLAVDRWGTGGAIALAFWMLFTAAIAAGWLRRDIDDDGHSIDTFGAMRAALERER